MNGYGQKKLGQGEEGKTLGQVGGQGRVFHWWQEHKMEVHER